VKVLGVDLGSRFVKLAVMDGNKIVSKRSIDTAVFYRDFCRNIDGKIEIDVSRLGVSDFDKIVGTGYGRNNINIKDAEIILELKAHTLGAVFQTGQRDFTLIDVGGQDSKVISVKDGKMADMILNDKCAASCGRYIESMANIIGISLGEIGKHHVNPVELSSTCAVFGESELIGRVSEGAKIEELAAGINFSLFKKIKPLLSRFPSRIAVITGGVAKNGGLTYFVKNEMNFEEVLVPEMPQLNGAIGCCVYGQSRN
jgi:predicted CoA-substrate-specific enzyme activase